MDSSENTYADLLPFNILDDDDDEGQPSKVDTEGPALTPVKEDVAPTDLRSYCKSKLLFDEPESPPTIEVVQPVGDDSVVARQRQPQKIVEPSTRKREASRKKELPRRHSENPERTVPCDSCNRKFVTLQHMKSHAVTHSNNKKIPCDLCPREFVNEGAFANHMRWHKNKSRRQK